jgi:hypothetical protein
MPFSDSDGKESAVGFLKRVIRSGDKVLDVGAGSGTYARLLSRTGAIMEGVEVFQPYVNRFGLGSLYSEVHVTDIRTFEPSCCYRVAILGDVLEHLNVEDAQAVIGRLRKSCCYGVISVPWLYGQGAVDGNQAEAHLQPDLTPEVMARRYPMLTCEYLGKVIGVYSWSPPPDQLTILIPTYARTNWLEQALWCAVRQSPAQRVVVLNDCAVQRLSCDHPSVLVVNDRVKCDSLGEKRNRLLRMAATDWVAWLDDDDWLLPWHCQQLIETADEVAEAVRPARVWFAEGSAGGKIRWGHGGGPIVMALRRGAALNAGGCAPVNAGEDQSLLSKLHQIRTTEGEPAYVYRWGNGVSHVSGAPLTDNFIRDAEHRLGTGQEPMGDVRLIPRILDGCFADLPSPARDRALSDWGITPS